MEQWSFTSEIKLESKKPNQTQTKEPSVTTPNNSKMVCAYPKVYQGFWRQGHINFLAITTPGVKV